MLEFIMQNLATIIIAIVLLAVVALITVRMVSNKKKGKSSCNCSSSCGGCSMAGVCHTCKADGKVKALKKS